MFRLQNNVPEVYPNFSRDFQIFCRLFDTAFNSVKQSINSMENISDTMLCNSVLFPLLKDKLGFFSDYDFTDTELRYILQAFPDIIRYKGSEKAIKYITNLYARITNASNLDGKINLDIYNDSRYVIELSSDKAITKTKLLFELLRYVLPTGYIIDYYLTLKHNTNFTSSFHTKSSIIYGEGLFLNLLDTSDKDCSYLKIIDNNSILCKFNDVNYYVVPNSTDFGVQVEFNTPTLTLNFVDNHLEFIDNSGILKYYLVSSIKNNKLLLTAVEASKITSIPEEEYTFIKNDDNTFKYVYNNTDYILGIKQPVGRIVIKKDVSTPSRELHNIINNATVASYKEDKFE